MAEYKDVIVTAGSGGFGGPLKLHPDAKQNKIVNITGGVISPVAKRLAEMTGCELVDGFKTSVPDDEILAVVIDCGGTARAAASTRRSASRPSTSTRLARAVRSRSTSSRTSTSRRCARRTWLLPRGRKSRLTMHRQKSRQQIQRHRAASAAATTTRRRRFRSSRPASWRRSASSWAASSPSSTRPAARPSTRMMA